MNKMAGDLTNDYLDSPMIRVVAGSCGNRREFYVHKALICGRSEYIKDAIEELKETNDPFDICLTSIETRVDESPDRDSESEDVEPKTTGLYLELLYVGSLPLHIPAITDYN
jgi:hypothetical protein